MLSQIDSKIANCTEFLYSYTNVSAECMNWSDVEIICGFGVMEPTSGLH